MCLSASRLCDNKVFISRLAASCLEFGVGTCSGTWERFSCNSELASWLVSPWQLTVPHWNHELVVPWLATWAQCTAWGIAWQLFVERGDVGGACSIIHMWVTFSQTSWDPLDTWVSSLPNLPSQWASLAPTCPDCTQSLHARCLKCGRFSCGGCSNGPELMCGICNDVVRILGRYPACCVCRRPVCTGPEFVDLPCLGSHLDSCKNCTGELEPEPEDGVALLEPSLGLKLSSICAHCG